MKKYTTPYMELTVISSADIITGSLIVSSESVFANRNVNISTDLGFDNLDITGF